MVHAVHFRYPRCSYFYRMIKTNVLENLESNRKIQKRGRGRSPLYHVVTGETLAGPPCTTSTRTRLGHINLVYTTVPGRRFEKLLTVVLDERSTRSGPAPRLASDRACIVEKPLALSDVRSLSGQRVDPSIRVSDLRWTCELCDVTLRGARRADGYRPSGSEESNPYGWYELKSTIGARHATLTILINKYFARRKGKAKGRPARPRPP